MMLDAFHPGRSIPWDYLWQSTLFLALGVAASLLLVRRPARAHRLLLLAVLATLCTPILAQAVSRGGWGLLTRPAEPLSSRLAGGTTEAPAPAVRAPVAPIEKAFPVARPEMTSRISDSPIIDKPDDPSRPASAAGESRAESPIRWFAVAFGAWLILSGLAVARLVISLLITLGIVRRARPVADEMLAAATAAANRLGLSSPPELRSSPRVRCPVIWCWRRRPVILLPVAYGRAAAPVDWVGVFCHELAHWVRRDHWSGLFAELLTCLIPWHPLAWLARHRLSRLSELACDDWALSTGVPADDYVESLLGLVPQRRTSLVLSAVSSRSGLVGRVRYILDERRIMPVVGRRWAFASASLVVLAASAIALAQTRPAASENGKAAADDHRGTSAATEKPAPAGEKPVTKHRVIRGQVLKPDGSPAANARVLCLGAPKTDLHPAALPKGQRARPSAHIDTLADTRTDGGGRFEVAADFDPERYHHEEGYGLNLVVVYPGVGLHSSLIKDGATDIAVRLVPQVIIRGRLLTPSGTPAAGVRVALQHFHNDEMTEGMVFDSSLPDDEMPSYWPRPRTTDADGRFTLEGVPDGTYAYLEFRHPDYATDEVTVNAVTKGGIKALLSAMFQSFNMAPVKPDFIHTLEPARPVQGRVTDKATGKPLAGMIVEVIPMGRHGGLPIYGRTDADGRYRVAGRSADQYVTTIFPPTDSGYLAVNDWHLGWPAGAKFLEKNFTLTKGRIIHGRVVDAGTQRPIAGAAVVYQPKPGNRYNSGNLDLRNPILSDSEGRFTLTTLPGAGFLAVETTDPDYMRVPVVGNYGDRHIFPQGVAWIDVPKEGEPPSAEVMVRKGVTLAARAIDLDGKPVLGVVGTCEGIDAKLIDVWNQGRSFSDGVFKMPGADPSRTYRVYFLHPGRKLGAFADLRPNTEAEKPVEVRLQPTAKVHGKLVSQSHSPVPGGQVNPAIVSDDKAGKMSREELLMTTQGMMYPNLLGQMAMMPYFVKLRSDARGAFVIDTLLPGVPFYVTANSGRQEAMVPVGTLMPGEDRDLGTITLKEMNQ